eukprot:SAG11_NODE_160_length_14023_cov_23.003017_3_plen_78_part_00
MGHKHLDLLPPNADTCVEDYCEILECNHDRKTLGPPLNCDVDHMREVRGRGRLQCTCSPIPCHYAVQPRVVPYNNRS